ncbi:MAG TPA: hydantoinase B/oxoprolinase family protein [Terriglobales bacterium]|nr:hydantoinase B/oxoprolinase family protein [Terriglobales bacterium]
MTPPRSQPGRARKPTPVDAIDLAIFKNAFHAIAEEMGATLRRTAFSPNIKERRDYSSALFDAAGQVIAMGDDMPVHLGSMPMSVAAALRALALAPGDVAILNDPYDGGTHLPDITLVVPVFVGRETRPAFFVANRAHHADVGGTYPGSMGLCREIYQEGIRIPPLKLVRAGELDCGLLALILNNVRTPREREGDLTAQIGACRIGAQRLQQLVAKYGRARVERNMAAMLDHSERLMRAELRRMPAGTFRAEDFLDSDGLSAAPVRLRVAVTLDPRRARAVVDFTGSDAQVAGSVNAVAAITYSATFYIFRCLLPEEAAPTAGLMRPVTMVIPPGSVVDARPPAAVAGGNVECSQRIVDVLLRAFAQVLPDRIPAASSGTMNNLTIGGLYPPGDARAGQPYAYYETCGGGMGAAPGADGLSGVHTHMSNTLNTPVEALEYAYPFRVLRYAYRAGSGGDGRHRGGDGLVRELELLAPAQVTLLADRRRFAPYGLAGGADGARGRTLLFEPGAQGALSERELPGKCNLFVAQGARLRLESPGGGGWGPPSARKPRS